MVCFCRCQCHQWVSVVSLTLHSVGFIPIERQYVPSVYRARGIYQSWKWFLISNSSCRPVGLLLWTEDDWAQQFFQHIKFMADLPVLPEAGGFSCWEEGAPPQKLQIFAACASCHRGPSLQRADRRWAQRRRQGGGQHSRGSKCRRQVVARLSPRYQFRPSICPAPTICASSARLKIRPMDVSKKLMQVINEALAHIESWYCARGDQGEQHWHRICEDINSEHSKTFIIKKKSTQHSCNGSRFTRNFTPAGCLMAESQRFWLRQTNFWNKEIEKIWSMFHQNDYIIGNRPHHSKHCIETA